MLRITNIPNSAQLLVAISFWSTRIRPLTFNSPCHDVWPSSNLNRYHSLFLCPNTSSLHNKHVVSCSTMPHFLIYDRTSVYCNHQSCYFK